MFIMLTILTFCILRIILKPTNDGSEDDGSLHRQSSVQHLAGAVHRGYICVPADLFSIITL